MKAIVRIALCILIALPAAPVAFSAPLPLTAYRDRPTGDSIIRKKLLQAAFPARSVTGVDVREINFNPLQKTGRHQHPVPVVGYIVYGTVIFQVEGQPARLLHAGDAFYEPANQPIARFDNASDKEPLKFMASYLLDGHSELIQMLPEKAGEH
jgi:quercetin dioxygenase-like cupin family protein